MRRLFLAAPILQRSSPARPSRRRAPTATATPNIPIYVETPDSFTIRLGVRRATTLCCISSVGDFSGDRRTQLSVRIYFKAVRSAETQQRLNFPLKDEAVVAQVRRAFERIMQAKSAETFTLRDEKAGDVVASNCWAVAR